MEVTLRGVWSRKVLRGGVRGVRAGVREKCAECSASWWFIEALQKHCFFKKCYAEVYAELFSSELNYKNIVILGGEILPGITVYFYLGDPEN